MVVSFGKRQNPFPHYGDHDNKKEKTLILNSNSIKRTKRMVFI